MRVVIAGGTGFLGRRLERRLREGGHEVQILTRRPRSAAEIAWNPDGSAGAWADAINGADAVINLAGEGIADARWTEARKQALRASRLLATQSLVAAMHGSAAPPAVFLSASGVGYYGPRGDEAVTEEAPPGRDFLAELCAAWEEAAAAAPAATRVVVLRTGLVLHPDGGALARMLLPFRLGLGGPIGSGRQYMPWIHLDDWVGFAEWLIDTSGARGAFNLTAPAPVRNADFARAVGRALHRPAFVPVPGAALQLALGELANALLTGQRAVPARAEALGFTFRYPVLEPALRDLLA